MYVHKCECLTEMRLFTNCEMGARYVFFSVRGLFLAVCPCDLRSGAIVRSPAPLRTAPLPPIKK